MAYSPFDTFMVRDDKATTIMQLILSLVPPLVEPRNVDINDTASFMIFHDNGKRAFDIIAPAWMVRAIEQAMAREHFDECGESGYRPNNIQLLEAMTSFGGLDAFDLAMFVKPHGTRCFVFTERAESPQHLSTDAAQTPSLASA